MVNKKEKLKNKETKGGKIKIMKEKRKFEKGITLIALVITIALNCSYLAMERIIEKEPKNLKIY